MHCNWTANRPVIVHPHHSRWSRALHARHSVHAAASASSARQAAEPAAALAALLAWCQGRGAPASALEAKRFRADGGSERAGLIAVREVAAGEVVLSIPESLAVTSVDAERHTLVGPVAQSCSELVALTLWLLAERSVGAESSWAPLLATLPLTSASPILWDDSERAELLAGSPVLQEARQRSDALRQQWAELENVHFAAVPGTFNPAVFNEAAFMEAFCVVLGTAVYLPAAGCFALVPGATSIGRTGNDNGCVLDYDDAAGTVSITATRPYRCGGCSTGLGAATARP